VCEWSNITEAFYLPSNRTQFVIFFFQKECFAQSQQQQQHQAIQAAADPALSVPSVSPIPTTSTAPTFDLDHDLFGPDIDLLDTSDLFPDLTSSCCSAEEISLLDTSDIFPTGSSDQASCSSQQAAGSSGQNLKDSGIGPTPEPMRKYAWTDLP